MKSKIFSQSVRENLALYRVNDWLISAPRTKPEPPLKCPCLHLIIAVIGHDDKIILHFLSLGRTFISIIRGQPCMKEEKNDP